MSIDIARRDGAIVAFLNARLDEDERAAKAATPGSWMAEANISDYDGYGSEGVEHIVATDAPYVVAGTGFSPWQAERDAAHIARHDPAHVLRWAAAMRLLVAEHTGYCCVKGTCCGEIAATYNSYDDPCPDLRILAAIWDGHDGYDKGWVYDDQRATA